MKTSSKNTYWAKLKDPRWQKKRLEILSIHNFACQECGSPDDTLHVHHPFYEKNKEPWDYDASALMCVCENCHNDMHYQEDIFNGYANQVKSGGNGRNLMFYAGLLAGFSHDGPIDIEVIDYDFADGIGIAFNKTQDEVIESLKPDMNGALNMITWETIFEWSNKKKASQ